MFCLQYPLGTAHGWFQCTGEHVIIFHWRFFYLWHSLQDLFPGSGKCCFFRLVLESFDQFLQPFDLFLLVTVRPFLNCQVSGFLFFIRSIVAGIADQFLLPEFTDRISRPVQKEPVMRDHDHGTGILTQILF